MSEITPSRLRRSMRGCPRLAVLSSRSSNIHVPGHTPTSHDSRSVPCLKAFRGSLPHERKEVARQWWPLNPRLTTDDKIGDAPANFLKEALEVIVQAKAARGKGKPQLPEILDMLLLALSVLGTDLYAHHRREQVTQLSAEVMLEGTDIAISMSSEPCGTYSEQDVLALTLALKASANTYQEAWSRIPHLRELLALFSVALSSSTASLTNEDHRAFAVSSITPIVRRKAFL